MWGCKEKLKKPYIYLSISIITEVFAASMLKLSNGLTEYMPLIGVALGYGISFYMLGIVLKYMPLSIAYAIWAGAGTMCTAIVSIVFFGEVFTLIKVLGVVVIVGGIILINKGTGEGKHEVA
mgnify:CR=1 FL=1